MPTSNRDGIKSWILTGYCYAVVTGKKLTLIETGRIVKRPESSTN
jgi:hypothetical protein